MRKEIFVYFSSGKSNDDLMGMLYAEKIRGKEVFSFEYSKNWLANNSSLQLDPDLNYFTGLQYLFDEEKPNFGMFLDSSPDRWGRVLLLRKEAALARKEKREKRQLFESDFLLGVYDGHRMGALRFKEKVDGAFISNAKELASPPWTSIRELEQISLKLEEDEVYDHPEYLQWLNMLVAPGSSLGGARPKASIIDPNEQLWIAKFPSKNDEFDSGAWEMIVCQLAREAGINMAPSTILKFSSKHHTFLTKRFDRLEDRSRLHFASAMTLLGKNDGDDYSKGVSYLDLVDFINRNGEQVEEDLNELWKRIVFSICVSNVDDHLRNHGFLLSKNGWILSPAYDINPIEYGTELKLNISETDNSMDIELALEVAPFFRLDEKEARAIIQTIKSVVKNWRVLAKNYGISNSECEAMSSAFRMAEK